MLQRQEVVMRPRQLKAMRRSRPKVLEISRLRLARNPRRMRRRLPLPAERIRRLEPPVMGM
jgi:hypothetical protein